MISNLSLSSFQSLPLEEKTHILRYQNNILTSVGNFDKEMAIHKGDFHKIFQFYVENHLKELLSKTQTLFISERSWADYEQAAFEENKVDSQNNFKCFFNGYSSVLASIEMLKFLKPHNLFNVSDIEDKIEIVKQSFEIKLKKFISFSSNDTRIQKYDLKILDIKQIEENAKHLVEKMSNPKIINFFDSQYRDYLRSRSDDYRLVQYNEIDKQFDSSIVDIDNFFDISIFSQKNIVSELLCAYFDTYKLYRNIIHKNSEFNTFQAYKNYRINSLKKVYFRKSEETELQAKINSLDENKLLDIYESNKKHFENKGIHLQSLAHNIQKNLCKVFNNTIDNNNLLLTFSNKLITSEFNGFKFFALPDPSVKEVSSEAYFGFSIPLNEKKLVEQIEHILANQTNDIRSEIEKIADASEHKEKIMSSNFYSSISMFEELNVHYYQKLFFKNVAPQSINVVVS